MNMNKVLEDLKKLKTVYYETETIKAGDDLEVTLRLLTSEEETATHSVAAQYEQGIAYLYAIKRETLCRSITSINGNKIPEFIEDGKEKSEKHIWLRENVVGGWSQILIDHVWSGYASLITKLETKIAGDTKKEES